MTTVRIQIDFGGSQIEVTESRIDRHPYGMGAVPQTLVGALVVAVSRAIGAFDEVDGVEIAGNLRDRELLVRKPSDAGGDS